VLIYFLLGDTLINKVLLILVEVFFLHHFSQLLKFHLILNKLDTLSLMNFSADRVDLLFAHWWWLPLSLLACHLQGKCGGH